MAADTSTSPAQRPLEVVGKRLPRVDARERVTGEAVYPADLALPGMVHAKLKRSPHAHARIRRIDTSRAEALAGVLAVVTAADFPELPVGATIPMGEVGYDMWMVAQLNIARHKVHWVGQPVAGVAAVDVHVAEAALALIEVEYEPLPAVLDIAAAMAPDAPVLHEHVLTKGVEPRPRSPSNVCSRTLIARGDAARALTEAAATARASVQVDTAHQGYLEPQVVVAQVDANGFATVWASTQGQFTAELMIARMLGLPQSQLKVVPLEIGGGFGGKIAIHGEAVAVRLAQKCRRPVKLVLTREEVLQGGSGPAAGALIDIAVGADRDGRLVAIEGTYRMDAGGLPGLSPSLLMQASAALYQCPNLNLVGYDVVTNKPRTEAYRGPGGIQAAFAMEQAMDALCQRLDMDPLEFRKRNASVTGSTMPIGTPFPAIGLTTILERGRRAPLLARSAAARAPSARARPGAGLLARHVDDLGGAHHDCRRRTADGDHGRRRHLRHAHDHGAGGGGGVRAAARGRAHPYGRQQVGRLQRWRRRQPRRAHDHGGAGGSLRRCARPAAQARRREAAMRPSRPRLRPRPVPVAPRTGGGDLARGTDAGDADRRRGGRPRRIDQAAAGRRDRRPCLRRGGRYRDRPRHGAALHRLPGRGPRAQPRRGRGPDRGQRGAGARLGADGRLRLRAGRPAEEREPARLPHAHRTRRAEDRLRHRRDAGARTCPTACAGSARCRSCRPQLPSQTPSPGQRGCVSGTCR